VGGRGDARCLNVENAYVFRYEDDGAKSVSVAAFAKAGVPDHPVGERLTTEATTPRARCGAPYGHHGRTSGKAQRAPLPNGSYVGVAVAGGHPTMVSLVLQ
jgi:hypothetical protein